MSTQLFLRGVSKTPRAQHGTRYLSLPTSPIPLPGAPSPMHDSSLPACLLRPTLTPHPSASPASFGTSYPPVHPHCAPARPPSLTCAAVASGLILPVQWPLLLVFLASARGSHKCKPDHGALLGWSVRPLHGLRALLTRPPTAPHTSLCSTLQLQ